MDPRRIAKGDGPAVNFLVGVYLTSETRIGAWVRQMFRSEDQRGLRSLRNRITVEIRGLMRRTPDLAREVVDESFSVAQREMERLRSRRRLSAIETKTAEVLAMNLTGGLRAAGETVGRRVDDIYRREALRVSLRGVEVNQPEAVTAGQLEQRLEREGITGFVDRAGRRWKLSTYARMATRTTAAEALSHGTAQKMLERGFPLAEVSSHGCSHHPEDPRHPCVRLEGQTIDLRRLEIATELPPYHPACTHYITPSVRNTEPEPVAA